MPSPPYEIRPFRDGDEAAVLALHARAFAGHPPRTRKHFEWKFRANPLGALEMIVAKEGERCLAVYAVVPQRCLLAGEPCVAGLQTDMAVDPALRGGLGGSRLILAVGEAYMRQYLGGAKQLEWGFPEPHLQRVCLAHLKVGVLRDVAFLVREPAPAPIAAPAGVQVRSVLRYDADLDGLWSRCSPALGTCTVRDARQLDWRYADHPDVRYTLLESRGGGGGELRGVAVVRSGGLDERLLSLMDWLVPEDDEECEAALLAHLCAEAVRRGHAYVATWFPLFFPIALRWQRRFGFFVRPTQLQESYRSWGGAGRRWLDEHWYQTMGDIDSL
jgi:hypothetical protein